MLRKIIFRCIEAIIVMLGVALLIFVMLRIVPGNPIAVMMGEHAKADVVEKMSKELGLNEPVMIQFTHYIRDALRGEFGSSYTLGRPVSELMESAFGNTLKLAFLSAAFAWILGIVSGVAAAAGKNTLYDHLFMGMSLMGVSMPVFMVAMLLQYLFAYHFHILPISGVKDFRGFILPAIALGWNSAGSVARLVRSSLIEILQEDYIDTALAKGRSRRGVLLIHAMKNAMLPVITMMALQLSSFLSGAVITETIFSINGIGRLAVQAISGRDIPLLQGTALFTTMVVTGGNLLADCLYYVLDPRIRREA